MTDREEMIAGVWSEFSFDRRNLMADAIVDLRLALKEEKEAHTKLLAYHGKCYNLFGKMMDVEGFGVLNLDELIARLREVVTALIDSLDAMTSERDELKAKCLSLEATRAREIAEARNKALEEAAKKVPTNWVDSLLTGPDSLGVMPWTCPHIERLLNGISTRIRSLKSPQEAKT
jgi:hypothetical protein